MNLRIQEKPDSFGVVFICGCQGRISPLSDSPLPLIPAEMLLEITGFFRSYVAGDQAYEVLVNIYWDCLAQRFIAEPPKQKVTELSVHSTVNPKFSDDRYTLYMEIHSHNKMYAFFSQTDDEDEKATRLYAVIGQLDKFWPDIMVRMSNGGRHMEINPALVFETPQLKAPRDWFGHVEAESLYKDTVQKEPHHGKITSYFGKVMGK